MEGAVALVFMGADGSGPYPVTGTPGAGPLPVNATAVLTPPVGGLPVIPGPGGFEVQAPAGGLPVAPPAGGLEVIPGAGGFEVEAPAGGLPVIGPAGGLPVAAPAGGLEVIPGAGGFEVEAPAGGLPVIGPAGGLPVAAPAGGLLVVGAAGGLEVSPPPGGLEVVGPAGGLQVQGAVAPGSAIAGVDPVLIAGQDGANVRSLLTDAQGRLVPIAVPNPATYSMVSLNTASPAWSNTSPLIVMLAGSASKTVKLQRIHLEISGALANSGSLQIGRSAILNGSGGALAAIPLDTANAAATANPRSFVAAPVALPSDNAALNQTNFTLVANGVFMFDWVPPLNSQPVTLRGAAQSVYLYLFVTTSAAFSMIADFIFTEE